MKTYKITGTTNSYIAQRDITFNGKTSIDLRTGLTLEEALNELADMFSEDHNNYYVCRISDAEELIEIASENAEFKGEGWYAINGGDVVSVLLKNERSYSYDSRYYGIAEENQNK